MERFKWDHYQKILLPLSLSGCLILIGCLPPKTVISLPEPSVESSREVLPGKKSFSEEERKLERLIRQLEETEQRLLETQRKTEEALQKMDNASQKTNEAAGRIQKAQEKIEAIGQKEAP